MGIDEIIARCVHCNELIEIRMILIGKDQVRAIRFVHCVGDDDEMYGKSGPKPKARCKGMMDYEVQDVYGEEVMKRMIGEFNARLGRMMGLVV